MNGQVHVKDPKKEQNCACESTCESTCESICRQSGCNYTYILFDTLEVSFMLLKDELVYEGANALEPDMHFLAILY